MIRLVGALVMGLGVLIATIMLALPVRAFDDPDLRPVGFENPVSGFIGVSATVPGPAPSTAATIISPAAGTRFTQLPVTVTGRCPADTFVIITKNGTFAGATPCTIQGTYNVDIDLEPGANRLVARVSDVLGQYGPDSDAVAVTYAPAGAGASGAAIGTPMYLQTDVTVAGGQPGTGLTRRINIVGGKGPYVVSWEWGDGQTTLARQAAAGPSTREHVYDRAGTYRVVVTVTDADGNTALLQVVTVMNGVAPAVTTAGPASLPGVGSLGLWPMYGIMTAIVITFWTGERIRLRRHRRRLRLAALAGAGA